MKWGSSRMNDNNDNQVDNQVIAVLIVIALICIILALAYFPFRIIGTILGCVAAVLAIILWQLILNEAYRKSRSEEGDISYSLFDTYKRKGGRRR